MKLSIQPLIFSIIASSMIIMFGAYYHYWYQTPTISSITESLAWIISLFSTSPGPDGHQLSPIGFYIDDLRIVKGLFAFSALLSTLALTVNLFHRKKYGVSKLFVSFNMVTISMLSCILYTTYKLGLLNNA